MAQNDSYDFRLRSQGDIGLTVGRKLLNIGYNYSELIPFVPALFYK